MLKDLRDRATGIAADAVGTVLGQEHLPESKYALAQYLFEKIEKAESTQEVERDRRYYLALMDECLRCVSKADSSHSALGRNPV